MERTKAYNSNSKNILSYAWAEATETLEIEFSARKGGQPAIYQYRLVPQSKWLGLLHAASAGTYLRNEIIPNYSAERIQ